MRSIIIKKKYTPNPDVLLAPLPSCPSPAAHERGKKPYTNRTEWPHIIWSVIHLKGQLSMGNTVWIYIYPLCNRCVWQSHLAVWSSVRLMLQSFIQIHSPPGDNNRRQVIRLLQLPNQ